MRGRDIFDAMRDIDSQLILDAAPREKSFTKRTLVKWGSLAACFCVITLGVVLLFVQIAAPVYEVYYKAYEVGVYDCLIGGIHTSELPIWSSENLNSYYDREAPKEATVTFNGVTYSGNYRNSRVVMPNLYVSHTYDGDGARFSINADTGELCSIMPHFELRTHYAVNEERCRSIADSIADDYIDLDEYKVDITVDRHIFCAFSYYREVEGFKTADALYICIDGDGRVMNFSVSMTDSFKGVREVDFDEDKVNETIKNKIERIYADVEYAWEYETESVLLVRMPDGRCAFLYSLYVYFDITDVEDISAHSTSRIKLLVSAESRASEK